MTDRQNSLYWREWSAAKRALAAAQPSALNSQLDEARHELHIEALGEDKSHLDFTNADFDKVLGALRAISKPGDLNAQLRQARGQHRRMHYELDRLMEKLGVDHNYVQGVVDQMAFHHPSSITRHPSIDDLAADELKKVLIALRKQTRRPTREPVEVPF